MDMEIFKSEEFGTLRTVEDDGKTLFCARDVANALGYKDTTNAIKKHCRSYGVAKRHPIIDQRGREQSAVFIPEGDVYRLIAHSKLPGAQRFESWVFDEVLPTIRKSGGYMVYREDETPEQLMARALKVAEDTLNRVKARNRELEPKAKFFDSCLVGDKSYSVTEAARLLSQTDKRINRSLLTALLREDGMLTSNRQATKKAIDRGYLFNYIPPAYFNQKTGQMETPKPYGKVTMKGLQWAVKRYCRQGELEPCAS